MYFYISLSLSLYIYIYIYSSLCLLEVVRGNRIRASEFGCAIRAPLSSAAVCVCVMLRTLSEHEHHSLYARIHGHQWKKQLEPIGAIKRK